MKIVDTHVHLYHTDETLYPMLAKKKKAHRSLGKPAIIDSCYAFASDGEVVRNRWPQFYTGSES